MRDYKSTTGSWGYSVTRDPGAPCANNLIGEYSGTGFKTSEQARADIHIGNHVSTTHYSAYKKSIRLIPFEFKQDRIENFWCSGTKYPTVKVYSGTRYPVVQWLQLVSSGSVHEPIVSNNTIAKARNNCLANLTNSDVDLGQSMGEAFANAGQLTEQAIKVGRALRYANHYRWRDAAYALGFRPGELDTTIADNFLAFKFGLKPIVNDMMNLHSSIQNSFNKQDAVLRAQGIGISEKGPYWISSRHVTGKLQQGCQVGVSYTISNSTLAGLNAMGLINPFALAWELLPLSFIVDWFLSVGDYLKGLSAPMGLTYLAGYETNFINTDATIVDRSWESNHSGSYPSYTIKENGHYRSVMTGFPMQSLSYNFGLGGSQGLVLSAIAAQISGSGQVIR